LSNYAMQQIWNKGSLLGKERSEDLEGVETRAHTDRQTDRSRAMRAEKRRGHRGGQETGKTGGNMWEQRAQAGVAGSPFICSPQLKDLGEAGDDISLC